MMFFGKKETTINEIKDLYLKGQISKAIALCESHLKKNVDDFDAFNLLTEMYYKTGDKNKYISLVLDTLRRLEEYKYYERAAAVLRKSIKYYPEYSDFYKYLARVFGAKGLVADQIGALKELANVYEKSGEVEKAIDILLDIFELDRNNLAFVRLLRDKLKLYKRDREICKVLSNCLEIAKKNNDRELVFGLVEDGLKNNCIFGKAIKFTFEYFEKNNDKREIFIKNATNALLQDFDAELFNQVTKYLDYKNDKDFYIALFNKYTDPVLFDYLIQFFVVEDMEKVFIMLERIKELPPKDFDKRYAAIFERYLDELPLGDMYDNLLVVAKMASNESLKIKVLNKVDKQEEPKRSLVLDLDQLDEAPKATEQSLFDMIERTELTADHEKTNFDIDLDLSEFQDQRDAKTGLEITSTEVDDKKQDVELFELDLSEHTLDSNTLESTADKQVDINESTLNDISLDFFEDVKIEVAKDEIIKVDFSKEIEEIEDLISAGKIEYAKVKLEDLMLLDPDNEQLKDLAVKLYSFTSDSQLDTNYQGEDQIVDMDPETKKIVKNIKDSIARLISHDDYEMHYDLAQAYFEMELYDEAIEEFKKSATGKMRCQSFVMIAESLKRLKRYNDAIDILKLILLDYGKDNEILKNTIYELASVYELKGDLSSSYANFQKIYSLDASFRDVKERLDRISAALSAKTDLGETTSPESQDTTEKKKKKISFV
ncbi:MAG: hypothetical protein N3C60_00230 [Calditerrivibrio sp.]|nr:hypothetical protein [Calditerrivibrio sp.]